MGFQKVSIPECLQKCHFRSAGITEKNWENYFHTGFPKQSPMVRKTMVERMLLQYTVLTCADTYTHTDI